MRLDSAVASVPVELHRVTAQSAGVVASGLTDLTGTFRIGLPPVDTAGFTVWFATADYLGVRYFGGPLHPNDSLDDYVILVHDTVGVGSPGSAVEITRRDVLFVPDPVGSWEISEIYQIRNPTARTLVGSSGGPTWEVGIPDAAVAFEAGESDADPPEVVRMGDRVLLMAPIRPGSRELYIRYRLPSSVTDLRIPIESSTESLNVFVAQPSPPIEVSGLGASQPFQADGRWFLRYGGDGLEPGSVVSVVWNASGPPLDPKYAALSVASVLLLVGAVAAFRLDRGATSRQSDTGTGSNAAGVPPS